MTGLRTVAQQALEALKMMRDQYEEYACPACDHADAAIYALKEALVEDAMQKFTDVNQEIEAALAEPVQEPVAWSFEARHIDTAFGPAVSIRHPGREHKYMRNVKPLYLAPPQRKPLTETSAERTLKRLGYTDCGGEFWKPPLGAPAEPVQEPVAHKHEWFSTGAMEPGKMRCIHCGIWNQENAPPQRKPLSEDEIAQAMYRADAIVTGPMQFRFAREIERAHGIT